MDFARKTAGQPRTLAVIASIALLLLCAAAVGLLIVPRFTPPKKDAGLRNHAHPAVLVGKWQGKTWHDTDIVLELDAKGNMIYRLIGAVEREWRGSWAFDNFSLYLQVEKVERGEAPQQNIVGWEMERFDRDELLLKEPPGVLRLVRQ